MGREIGTTTAGNIKQFVYFSDFIETDLGKQKLSEYLSVLDIDDNGTNKEFYKLTRDLVEFIIKTYGFVNNTDFETTFGKGWVLEISGNATAKDDANKKVNISHLEFEEHLNTDFNALKRSATKFFNTTKRGSIPTPKTVQRLTRFLHHENNKRALCDTKNAKPVADMINSIIDGSDVYDAIQITSASSKKRLLSIKDILDKLVNGKYLEVKKILKLKYRQHEKIAEEFIRSFYEHFFPSYKIIEDKVMFEDELFGHVIKREPDIILYNEFGLLQLIEVKLPTFNLFTWDKSHNKFKPSSHLSAGISQLNNYLRAMSNRKISMTPPKTHEDEYNSLASGILIIGDSNKMVKDIAKVNNGKTVDENMKLARMELLTINSMNPRIKIVPYNELIQEWK